MECPPTSVSGICERGEKSKLAFHFNVEFRFLVQERKTWNGYTCFESKCILPERF